MVNFFTKLRHLFIPESVKVEPTITPKMPLVYCVDCEETRPATRAMRCSKCGSDAIALMTRHDVIQELEAAKRK